MIALCLNAGSSSNKVGVFKRGPDGNVTCLLETTLPATDADRADQIWATLRERQAPRPSVIGHRIVFGGPDLLAPTIADEATLRTIEGLIDAEPLHLPLELDLVRSAMARFPGVPHVLCFDTAFYRSLPDIATKLPLPPDIDPLLRRYGFHGLSFEYLSSAIPRDAERTVLAHLGSGSSLCALLNGSPIETSMGFSALGGLVMNTRPGDLDPGIFLRLLADGFDRPRLTELFFHRSGMAAFASKAEATEFFIYSATKQLGAMIAVLNGLDALVFTGGIGEHQPAVRSAICRQLAYAGVRIDEAANAANSRLISTPDGKARVYVMPTNENAAIARHAFGLVSG